ncbi:MAG: hypothetical protein KJO38_04865 [Gammaproteobacteria bacterium]|nr:hypothetical protein [Gammaproteobacteria bacterium]
MHAARILTIAALSLAGINAHAGIGGYGAVAEARTFDDCSFICSPPGGVDASATPAGGEFATSALVDFTSSSGRGFAEAAFTGDVFTPLLRALGSSPAGQTTGGEGIATAIQRWAFTGASPEDFSVTVTVDADFTLPNANSDVEARGRFAVYTLSDPIFTSDYSTGVLEEIQGPANDQGALFETGQVSDSPFFAPGSGFDTETVNFTLNPGDVVYVFAQLAAKGENGGISDATSTLTVTFGPGDPVQLLSATVVPVPAAVWLFGPAVLTLAGIGRRRRASL